jgi:hypothetical protein
MSHNPQPGGIDKEEQILLFLLEFPATGFPTISSSLLHSPNQARL